MTAYYVEPPPVGNDTTGTGSPSAPWATLQHAVTQFWDATPPLLHAGDMLVVRPGIYDGFQMGTNDWERPYATSPPAVPTTFRAEPGATIVGQSAAEHAIHIYGWHNLIIEGFTIIGTDWPSGGRGINVVGVADSGESDVTKYYSKNVVIRNNRIIRPYQFGIHVGHTIDAIIHGNYVTDTLLQHGIYVTNGSIRPVVVNNTCINNGDSGIQLNGDHDFVGSGTIVNAVVVGNVIRVTNLNMDGGALNCDGLQDSVVAYNLITDSIGGITLYWSDAAAPAVRNRVLHNTIIQMPASAKPPNPTLKNMLQIKGQSTDNLVRGNLLYTPNLDKSSIEVTQNSMSGLDSDFNLVVDRFETNDGGGTRSLAQWRSDTGQEMHSSFVTQDQLDRAVATYESARPAAAQSWLHRGRS